MSLAAHHVEALRSQYGVAYVTGALDDLHAHRAHSSVIGLVGLDAGQRGSWASAQKLIAGAIEEDTASISVSLKRIDYARVMQVVATGNGMSFGYDSFRDLVRKFREGLVTVALEGWRTLVDALLAAFRSFCNFLSALFNDDPTTLASIHELQQQADTRQGWLKAPLQALTWLWTSAWRYLKVIGTLVAAGVDAGAQFIGNAMQWLSDVCVVTPIRAVARQGLVMVFFAYNLIQDTILLGKKERATLEAHIRACTAQWPQYILDLVAALSLGTQLLSDPLAALMRTPLFGSLLAVGVQGVLYVLRTLASFIGNLCVGAAHLVQHFLAIIIGDKMTYINNVVGRLAARVSDLIPVDPQRTNQIGDAIGDGVAMCEAVREKLPDGSYSHLIDVFDAALAEARTFQAEQVKHKERMMPSFRAAHDNARIMAAQFMDEDLFSTDEELRERWALHNTGQSYTSFVGRTQAIVTLLDDALYSYAGDVLQFAEGETLLLYPSPPPHGLRRRRRPATVPVEGKQLIGNPAPPTGMDKREWDRMSRSAKIEYCEGRIKAIKREDRRYEICKDLIEKRLEPLEYKLTKGGERNLEAVLAKVRKSALLELNLRSGVQDYQDIIDKLRATDPWASAFNGTRIFFQGVAVVGIIGFAVHLINHRIANAAEAEAWNDLNKFAERSGVYDVTKDDAFQSLLLRKYQQLLVAKDMVPKGDGAVTEFRRGFNQYQCAIMDAYQHNQMDELTFRELRLSIKETLASRLDKLDDPVMSHLKQALPTLDIKDYYYGRVKELDMQWDDLSDSGTDVAEFQPAGLEIMVQQTKQIVGALYPRYAEKTGGESRSASWLEKAQLLLSKLVTAQDKSFQRATGWAYETLKNKGATGLDLPDFVNLTRLLENIAGGNSAYVFQWLALGLGGAVAGYAIVQLVLLLVGATAVWLFTGAAWVVGADTQSMKWSWQNNRNPGLWKCVALLVASVALPVLVVQLIAWIFIFAGVYTTTALVASAFGYGGFVLAASATMFEVVFRKTQQFVSWSRLPLSRILGYAELDMDPESKPARKFRRDYYDWLGRVYDEGERPSAAGLEYARNLRDHPLPKAGKVAEPTGIRDAATRQVELTKMTPDERILYDRLVVNMKKSGKTPVTPDKFLERVRH